MTFEEYWNNNRRRLLEADGEYRKIQESYKMSSGADWLLFGIPVVGAILVFNQQWFASEVLNWLAAALVTVVLFAISAAVKTKMMGLPSLSEVEERIKAQAKKDFENNNQ